jgi:hypothetical protein
MEMVREKEDFVGASEEGSSNVVKVEIIEEEALKNNINLFLLLPHRHHHLLLL